MWSSQVAATLRAAGFEVTSRASMADLSDEELEHLKLIVVDLSSVSADAEALPDSLRADAKRPVPVLAIGPHVHTAKLAAARQLGWEVVTRGQFHAQHADILHNVMS